MTTEPSSLSESLPVPVIGIVGGIGSGKSSVSRWVGQNTNVMVIDADQLGHEALRSTDVKSALRKQFGDGIFDDQGEVSRGALARRVFGGEPQRQARFDLEKIVHPAIEQRVLDLISRAEHESKLAVLLDAAVLFEAGWQRRCDAVVFVDAPEDVRQLRTSRRNGWDIEELRRREASQLGLEEKKRLSDFTISNATDDTSGGQELLDFLCGRWGICCKVPPNSSQQSQTSSEILPP